MLLLLVVLFYAGRFGSKSPALTVDSVAPGQVRIRWNPHSIPVAGGASGTLEIRDGDSLLTVPLDDDRLHYSSVFYSHRSGNLSITLRVEGRAPGSRPLVETVRFHPFTFDASAQAPAPQAVVAPEPVEPPPAARAPIPVAPRRAAKLSRAEKKALLAAARTVVKKPESPNRRVVVPPPMVKAQAQPILPPAPAAALVASPITYPNLLSAPASVSPPPRPSPSSSDKVAYSGPRSGRLMWTGSLARRGMVEIDGSHASMGRLVGGLPGLPVSLSVSPAEFRGNALLIFSADPTRADRREQAAPGNAWNTTQFRFDPNRSAELIVLETPAAVNDFKRLVLRSDARQCSVIVIDWKLR